MGKQRIFTSEQENFILNNYKTMSNKDMAKKLDCKREQINSFLLHRGIKRGKKYTFYQNQIFSNEDIDFIIRNYNNMTATQIGNVLGFSKGQIDGKISKLNLKKKKREKNECYFSKIDSPIKAYFLGFIFADGYIIYNPQNMNYELGMRLQSQDKYVLEKLNEEIGGQFCIYHNEPKTTVLQNENNKIIHSNDSDTLRVYSKKIVEDLISHGVVPNKTQNDIYPIVDDEYFFDFLRGYIDGDGCYYINNGYTYMHITCSSQYVLKYLQQKLLTYNIETKLYCEKAKKYRLMCISKNEMSKLVNRLYYKDDLFFLKRKYNLIEHFIGPTT